MTPDTMPIFELVSFLDCLSNTSATLRLFQKSGRKNQAQPAIEHSTGESQRLGAEVEGCRAEPNKSLQRDLEGNVGCHNLCLCMLVWTVLSFTSPNHLDSNGCVYFSF